MKYTYTTRWDTKWSKGEAVFTGEDAKVEAKKKALLMLPIGTRAQDFVEAVKAPCEIWVILWPGGRISVSEEV